MLINLLICSLSLSAWAKAPGTYYQVKSQLQQVSQKNILDFVNGLVMAGSPSRMIGSPGHEKAKIYIESMIDKIDPKKTGKISVQTFNPDTEEAKRFYQRDFDTKVEGKIPKNSSEFIKWSRFTQYMKQMAEKLSVNKGQTIIWEKLGLDSKKVLVITAHYDTISHNPKTLEIDTNEPMPGANYNASGVAVALGLLKILADVDLNYTVQVVFLDWQGVGFLGSFDYAKQLMALQKEGKSILGVINLEMLGQDTSFYDKTKQLGNLKAYVRQNPQEIKFAESLITHGSKIQNKLSFEVTPNNFESSDNIRFWEKDFLSVTFSQNWEDDFNPKFYQTRADTPETLNHDTLYKVYQYLGGSVLGVLLDITK